ncbi:hypothetical protein SAMD00019534_043290 [Acytostelium subglobosum LB1]|uniref:hypothetical protein n=1 Tax=Acytostelium subglobosum LB1 TaxID=1410327 RepID=UPI00064480BE|nr:hypothetical protein SAMD00019534_043290 [Acytostelium subglobosum LB1]GAM21154.1 hypothetical protein SAMD00019534_043290 [Acytostelium subglobosum LB1]|eukprot:XP_012756288.1 hypothetical protein SAMD00019534_043290 [Acytostelium subglobosum LB1]
MYSYYILLITLIVVCFSNNNNGVVVNAQQAHAECLYSHSLPDDSILLPDSTGRSMFHDFFGNTESNGFSTIDSMYAKPNTTCDVLPDASSYWIPALKVKGMIIRPSYTKIYYQGGNSSFYPVSVMPRGLQIIAGNPKNTGRARGVWFLCNGYNRDPVKYCPASPDTYNVTQYNFNLIFPNCWDGVNIRPNFTYRNAVFDDKNIEGKCPPDYPVRIPTLNMQIAYYLNETDLSDAQLSLNPVVVNGTWTYPWASLYSAHADFFNAWDEESMKYMVEECLNKNRSCENRVPRVYGPADATFAMVNNKKVNTPVLQINNDSIPFIKITIPDRLKGLSWASGRIEINCQNNNLTALPDFINVYQVTAESFASSSPVCPNKNRVSGIYLDGELDYRGIDITDIVRNATVNGVKELYFCLRSSDGVETYSFESMNGLTGKLPRILFMDPGKKIIEQPLPGLVPYLYVDPPQPKPNTGAIMMPSLAITFVSLLLAIIIY